MADAVRERGKKEGGRINYYFPILQDEQDGIGDDRGCVLIGTNSVLLKKCLVSIELGKKKQPVKKRR